MHPIAITGRRAFLTGTGALAAAAFAAPPGAPRAAHAAKYNAPPSLTTFHASAVPFGPEDRFALALDALTYFVRQQGIFPGRWIYQLPVPPWYGGYEPRNAAITHDVTVPGGAPLFLLAHAEQSGDLDPSLTTISLDGAELADPGAFLLRGVNALSGGRMHPHAVLGLVLAPPPAGGHTVEVRNRGGGVETTVVYRLRVELPDALAPVLLRDPSGAIHAVAGHERRRVPDVATLRALGFPDDALASAAAEAVATLPQGAPLPALRDGMIVRESAAAPPFLLRDGRRVPFAYGGEVHPVAIEPLVLRTITPELQDGMVVHGALADLFHVESLRTASGAPTGAAPSLRKVPGWKWLEDKDIRAPATYVPDRIIAALPQNSPHWVMPGGVFQDRTFYSAAIGRTMPYRLYLPPDYSKRAASDRRFPVVYLLHGQSGRYDEWSGYGVEMVANDLWKHGKFAQVILVAPQGGLGYWMNQDGGTRWGDYVAKDLVNHLDATYRTIAQREARAIGGLSMGGHGALQIALNFPDLFGAVGAHSPSIRPRESAPAFMGGGAFFANRDPLSLIERAEIKSPPRIWLDSGRRDPWKPAAEALHTALTRRGWAHEWRLYDGEHDGWYWGDHLWDYLPFYAKAFQAAGVPVGM